MPTEIKELVIKVKIEDSDTGGHNRIDFEQLKTGILKECRKEIKRQLRKSKER
jgi:hypothetical protein